MFNVNILLIHQTRWIWWGGFRSPFLFSTRGCHGIYHMRLVHP